MMVSKGQMNVIIMILILGIVCIGIAGLANSGMLIKEKKYIQLDKPDNYITFNMKTQKAFLHWGTVNQIAEGNFVETETDYSIFPDKTTETLKIGRAHV
jgi:hypothetical protein